MSTQKVVSFDQPKSISWESIKAFLLGLQWLYGVSTWSAIFIWCSPQRQMDGILREEVVRRLIERLNQKDDQDGSTEKSALRRYVNEVLSRDGLVWDNGHQFLLLRAITSVSKQVENGWSEQVLRILVAVYVRLQSQPNVSGLEATKEAVNRITTERYTMQQLRAELLYELGYKEAAVEEYLAQAAWILGNIHAVHDLSKCGHGDRHAWIMTRLKHAYMWFSRAKRILLEIQAASVCPEAWFDTAYLDSQLKWIRETGDTIQKSWGYSPIDWDGLK